MRTIAATAAATLMVLGFTDHLDSSAAVWCMVIASVIAVLDNGLESTAITEFAGPYWSGRALGTQNTTQRLAAAVGQPIFGALIASGGYPLAWAVCGLFPLVAVPLVPARLVPPGLSATAPRRSGRRFGRWKTARSPAGQVSRHRPIHPRRGGVLTEVGEQQRHRHDRRGRVSDALTGDIGRAAVDRFEHRRVGAGGVDIAAGGQADAAAHRRRQVGDDVAEQVVGDDDVEPARVGDQVNRRRVDVLIGHLDLRELLTDLIDGPRP
ncbi:hypothetical protein I553_7187 [Mycobacterium xenopi 4042]|uniref:Major Facilitator Superfamily protein n=1 Tax=Mycobacterium xenopi 4042 TaxID=1299334 RepID=X7Z3L9_MYCXE|nr:hypothetical protein I553_7187 [Mycobacterium xenopi 4042]